MRELLLDFIGSGLGLVETASREPDLNRLVPTEFHHRGFTKTGISSSDEDHLPVELGHIVIGSEGHPGIDGDIQLLDSNRTENWTVIV